VAQASLGIFANLQLISLHAKRAGNIATLDNEPAFFVVMFKKFSGNLPLGLTSDTFGKLSTFATPKENDA
jgi:hypothetical protein